MNFIINPGSGGIDSSGEGWANTHDQAKRNAYEWFYKPMLEEGVIDIKVTDTKKDDGQGRWLFEFRHEITDKVIELWIHGIDNMEAYTKEHIFGARTYWNGSSSSIVELEQFAADGFEMVKTFKKKEQ